MNEYSIQHGDENRLKLNSKIDVINIPKNYFVTTVFDWAELLPELQGKIMSDTSRRVVEVFTTEEHVPKNNPEIINLIENLPWLPSLWISTTRKLELKRRRVSIKTEGLLTVNFSHDADKEFLSSYELIPDARNIICAAMHFQQTWTNVAKIRMIPLPHDWSKSFTSFMFQFVIRDKDGKTVVADADHRFSTIQRTERKDAITRRFVQELNLTHAVVNGIQIRDKLGLLRVVNSVDEFSV